MTALHNQCGHAVGSLVVITKDSRWWEDKLSGYVNVDQGSVGVVLSNDGGSGTILICGKVIVADLHRHIDYVSIIVEVK